MLQRVNSHYHLTPDCDCGEGDLGNGGRDLHQCCTHIPQDQSPRGAGSLLPEAVADAVLAIAKGLEVKYTVFFLKCFCWVIH